MDHEVIKEATEDVKTNVKKEIEDAKHQEEEAKKAREKAESHLKEIDQSA